MDWIEASAGLSQALWRGRGGRSDARPDAELGVYVVPEVNGLTEPLTGQQIRDLAPLADWIEAHALSQHTLATAGLGPASAFERWRRSRGRRRWRSSRPIRNRDANDAAD